MRLRSDEHLARYRLFFIYIFSFSFLYILSFFFHVSLCNDSVMWKSIIPIWDATLSNFCPVSLVSPLSKNINIFVVSIWHKSLRVNMVFRPMIISYEWMQLFLYLCPSPSYSLTKKKNWIDPRPKWNEKMKHKLYELEMFKSTFDRQNEVSTYRKLKYMFFYQVDFLMKNIWNVYFESTNSWVWSK